MARVVEKLSAAKVQKRLAPGMYGDGGGLWLRVGPNGAKSWALRYMVNGRAREMGLGPIHTIGLAEARERARRHRRELLDGIDPLAAREANRAEQRVQGAAAITFQACAEKLLAAKRPEWTNPRHADEYERTLVDYAYPVIGELPVGAIEIAHVTQVLEPIWTSKRETASRLRGRIEAVLDYAAVHRWREGENPARWRGHLEHVLARKKKGAAEHHPALPWQQIGAFMEELQNQQGVGALALRFVILTASRTNEVIGARWSEIDLSPPRVRKIRDEGGDIITVTEGAVWTVPPERMKARREHRVPLSDAAMDVLREATKLGTEGFVFAGRRTDRSLSPRTMITVLERMKRDDVTIHGFRSTFRDWAGDNGKAADIAEAALAHVVGDKTVTAYQRGDLLERRRQLMAAWGRFCASPIPASEAIPFRTIA